MQLPCTWYIFGIQHPTKKGNHMETVLWRQQEGACKVGPLSPETFYPVVRGDEQFMWIHWLPTSIVFDCKERSSGDKIASTLASLRAPAKVLEEFSWAWRMNLFESYEIRTPARRDHRDPLLLGYVNRQQYRIALWGESLLPLERIAALVNQSIEVRRRAAKNRCLLGSAGTMTAFLLLLGGLIWSGQQPRQDGIWEGMFVLGMFICLIGWLPTLMNSPENVQHDFLDRYRR
jgi:hypothetical protein